jgi:cell division protein ZapA
MSAAKNNTVEATIAGRTFALACGPDERADLEAALALVSERVDEAYTQSASSNSERLLLLAALNLAHDLRRLKTTARGAVAATPSNTTSQDAATMAAMAALKRKIESVLS